MIKRLYLFLVVFVCSWFMVGCIEHDAHAQDLKLGPVSDPDPVWHPSAHPPGTLLRDSAGDLWMVDNWLERRLVSGDDILGEAGINDADAISMNAAEERCLIPVDDEYWYPRSTGWYDYYSPVNDDVSTVADNGLWLINWDRHLRRRSSHDALHSWGFGPWTNDFTEGDGDWTSFRPINSPLGFRDGSMFLTERGEYFYMIDDGAWRIDPVLAESVGYDLDLSIRTTHDQFFRQTHFVGELVREAFSICPVLESIGEYPDVDGDGSPSARDCDDRNASITPFSPELCNGIDDNCDGLIDDVEVCLGGAP